MNAQAQPVISSSRLCSIFPFKGQAYGRPGVVPALYHDSFVDLKVRGTTSQVKQMYHMLKPR